eukprot:m.332321 g.332321  ORF g.332321 m.332321 type:complete len:471 (+) comp16927_c0_seq1:223-1635(+)
MATGADTRATATAINAACRKRGGKYSQYSCTAVSWDDAARGTFGGGLSCWGGNITDTYLKAKNGTTLYTVRSNNWNEKLGQVDTSSVAVLVGNESRTQEPLRPLTLRDFLKNAGQRGQYAGIPDGTDLSDDILDKKCSIRFQTTFLPVKGDRGTLEFATEAYNYNTQSDSDPRNLVLLATTQGTAVQQDGKGTKRLYHHAVDNNGVVSRHWLEAERSDHKVGGPQKETKEEREDALARGKATSSVIGIKAMGTRFNVLMTIQVPLEKKATPRRSGWGGGLTSLVSCNDDYDDEDEDDCHYGNSENFVLKKSCKKKKSSMSVCAPTGAAMLGSKRRCRGRGRGGAAVTRVGRANAARVSRGSKFDTWGGLKAKTFKRDKHQHITVTVVMYNTVEGGVPSEADVAAAIDDLENLYSACEKQGRLGDSTFDFMKSELTLKESSDIKQKVITQPYQSPPSQPVQGYDVFPTDSG